MGGHKEAFTKALDALQGAGEEAGLETAEKMVVPDGRAIEALTLLDGAGRPNPASAGVDLLHKPDKSSEDFHSDDELWKIAGRVVAGMGAGDLGPLPSTDDPLLGEVREAFWLGFELGMRRGLVRQARVLLAMERWQQPGVKPTEVIKALVLSTGHMPQWASLDLGGFPGVSAVEDREYGWWMWVPDDPAGDNRSRIESGRDPVPWDILVVQMYARKQGCDWVRYDRDGDRDDALPWWDW